MRDSGNNNYYGGIGFTGALFLVFLVLKLTNYIDWSWWWITAPLWVPLALVVVILLGCFVYVAFTTKSKNK